MHGQSLPSAPRGEEWAWGTLLAPEGWAGLVFGSPPSGTISFLPQSCHSICLSIYISVFPFFIHPSKYPSLLSFICQSSLHPAPRGDSPF